MRITYVVTSADSVGGTERSVHTQVTELSKRHAVTVLAVYRTGSPGFELTPRVELRELIDRSHELPRLLAHVAGGTLAHCAELAATPSAWVPRDWEGQLSALSDLVVVDEFRRLDTDVLVTTTPALLSLAVRFCPTETVIVHQEHRTSERRTLSLPPLVTFGPAADAVAFLTEGSRDRFADIWGTSGPAMPVVGNAVADEFRPIASLDTKVVTLVARLRKEKRPLDAVQAFAMATRSVPGWQLRIFGDGPQRRAVRSLIQDLDAVDSILLLGETRHMSIEWGRSSIALLTSEHEGFPLSPAEALSTGVPVVSYASPNGVPAVVRDGVDGLLTPVGDVSALSESLVSLMASADRRAMMGRAAREGASRFDVRAVTSRWEEVLVAAISDAAVPTAGAKAARHRRRALSQQG